MAKSKQQKKGKAAQSTPQKQQTQQQGGKQNNKKKGGNQQPPKQSPHQQKQQPGQKVKQQEKAQPQKQDKKVTFNQQPIENEFESDDESLEGLPEDFPFTEEQLAGMTEDQVQEAFEKYAEEKGLIIDSEGEEGDDDESVELPEDFPYTLEQLGGMSEDEVEKAFEEYFASKGEALDDSEDEGETPELVEVEQKEIEQVTVQKMDVDEEKTAIVTSSKTTVETTTTVSDATERKRKIGFQIEELEGEQAKKVCIRLGSAVDIEIPADHNMKSLLINFTETGESVPSSNEGVKLLVRQNEMPSTTNVPNCSITVIGVKPENIMSL